MNKTNNIRKLASLSTILVLSCAGPAAASGDTVCALLWPYFQQAPSHFLSERGPQTSDKAWEAKPNKFATALNAKCGFTTYIEGRNDLDCATPFAQDKIAEQDAFYKQAVIGADFCVDRLQFGDEWRRTVDHTDNKGMISDSTTWYKTKGDQQFGVAVTETTYKSLSSREVKITVFYEAKP